MSSVIASASETVIPLGALQDLYDRHKYLDAYALSEALWNPRTDLQHLTIDELVIAGRLAGRLGGQRLSRWLFRAAYTRDPSNPRARYFAHWLRSRGWRVLDDLREFEREPDLGGDDDEIRAAWFAAFARTWASLRDFDRAYDCLDRAHSLSPDDAWVSACESGVHGVADRWSDALCSAERAWQVDEGAPFAATALGESLLSLGRVEECATRLAAAAEASQSYDLVADACWRQCAFAERLGGAERRSVLDAASALADRLPALAPLIDRETRKTLARLRLDIANLADDDAGIEKWAAELRLPFFRHVLSNLHANPEGRRIRLPFHKTRQKYESCLPASLSAAMSAGGMTLSADEMASALTFGGTPEWAAADWLRARGLHVRFFATTPDVATRLISSGIAFVLILNADEGGHAVAVIGVDERAGTLLVHDPQFPRETLYLFEVLRQNASPLGVTGMAVVPTERAGELDELLPEDSVVNEAAEDHQRALRTQGPSAARAVAVDLARRFAGHSGTRYIVALQALHEGEIGRALNDLKELLAEFPRAPTVRVAALEACRALSNTALLRSVLRDVVERGVLPGLQSEQEWVRPPDRYISEYADLLRLSSATRDEAERLLHALLRRQPLSAIGWHILADLLWHTPRPDDHLLCLRLAASLAPGDEHYARSYADALVAQRRDEEALRWLESRARERGNSLAAVSTWVTWIGVLEDVGRPERALDACREALECHPESPELLAFAVPFLARMGLWEQADDRLQRLASVGHPAAFHEAAAYVSQMRGDVNAAVEHAEAWVAELPQSIAARQRLLDALSTRDGADAALSLATAWLRDQPRHELLEQLYCDQLDRAGSPKWRKYSVQLRRTRRNREDAVAWGDVAFECVQAYRASSDARRVRLGVRIATLLAECERSAGDAMPTLRLRASWADAQGRWPEAVELWLACIDRDPAYSYAYRRAWECSARFTAEERQRVWSEMRSRLLHAPGRLTVARDVMVLLAERFGVREAAAEVERWRVERPDDPDVIEAAVDVLIEHGHGRSDAERALALLDPAVQHHPYHPGLRLSLAYAFRRAGQHAEAEKVLLDIVRRHPGNSVALVQLALTRQSQGDPDAAFGFLDTALSRDPQNPAVIDVRAQLLLRNGRKDDALAWIDRGLERFRRNVAWRQRAVALLNDCGSYDRAVAVAREGVAVAPCNPFAWLLLGQTLNDMHRYAAVGEIGKCFRRSLSLDRSLADAAGNLVVWLAGHREQYDEAEQVVRDLEPCLADGAVARALRAFILRRRGDKPKAVSDIAEVTADAPWYAWSWMLLVQWLVEDQSWDLAKLLLAEVPPQMLTHIEFRKQRLAILQRAGVDQVKLDAEWDDLIRDFPDDPSIPATRGRASEPVASEPAAEPSRSVERFPWWAWFAGGWILLQLLRTCS